MAPALAILAAFLYGVSMVTAKIGLKSMDTFTGAVISMGASVIGSLVLLIFFVPLSHFASVGVIYFIFAGLSGPCAGRVLLYSGIRRVGSSTASTLYSIKPLFSAIAAVLILKEALTAGIGVATVMMVAGLAVVSAKDKRALLPDSWKTTDLLFPIAAGAAYGLAHVFRKIGLNINHDPMLGVIVQNVAALSVSITPAFVRGKRVQVAERDLGAWAAFGLSGLFSLLGQVVLFQALEIGNVEIVSPLSAISPLFVIAMAWIFLRQSERITGRLIVGALLIVAGTVLLTLLPYM